MKYKHLRVYEEAPNEGLEGFVIILEGNKPHVHADIIHAWAEGAKIYRKVDGELVLDENPDWGEENKYVVEDFGLVSTYQWLFKPKGSDSWEGVTDHLADSDLDKEEFEYQIVPETVKYLSAYEAHCSVKSGDLCIFWDEGVNPSLARFAYKEGSQYITSTNSSWDNCVKLPISLPMFEI